MTINLEAEFGDFLDLLEDEFANLSDDLTHFGVKGMKWGVRKSDPSSRPALKSLGPDSVSRKTARGETITLSKKPPSKFQEFMGRHSAKYRKDFENYAYLTIKDGAGKRVGDAEVIKRNSEELNLMWLGIDRSSRGRGYATAVMKAGAEFGRQQGFKKLTLEVPGDSPDARHIYEKIGFKVTEEAKSTDDYWGGLTKMEYAIDDKVKHADSLAHFGVKGMKWGVRKSDIPGVSRRTSREAAKDAKEFARAKAFYGEGAGTRRKLIKQTVEGKIRRDPSYKKAFDQHLADQDTSKHVSKAKAERKRKNVKNSTAKTARGISHMIRGNTQYASAAAAGLFVAGAAIHKAGIDKIVVNAGKKAYKSLRTKNVQSYAGKPASEFLRDLGF